MALIRPKRNDIFLYMRMLYLRTEKSVVNELKRQQASGLVDYGTYAALMRIQQTLQEMQDESFTYVPEMVNKVFRDANARAGYEAAEALSVAQTAIVEQLTGNLLGCITEAAEQAYKTSEGILQLGRLHPDVFRNPVILSSALAEAEGRGMSPAVTRALHSLQNDNITSFVDRSGREWGLTEYCTMATRTVRTQATVAANLTSDDWDLWKITPNGSTCALCAAYEGRVYSKSGTNPDYPPLSTAFGKIDPAGGNDLSNTYLNIHPNCLHSLVRYTTAGRTDEEIQKDKDFSSFEKRPADVDYRTKKQIEEYRDKERKRAEFLETRRQWNEYRERLGDKIPSLETFEKHKKAGDDKYKEWMSAYRKKGAELRKEVRTHGLAAGPRGADYPHPHDPPKQIGTLKKNQSVMDVLRDGERDIIDEPIENAIVVLKDGTIHRSYGDLNGVYPDEDFGDRLYGASVTHNHPEGSTNEWSFSPEDQQLFDRYKLAVLRGSDSRFVYEMNRNPDDVDESNITVFEATEYDMRHIKNIERARLFGYGYRRWERGHEPKRR